MSEKNSLHSFEPSFVSKPVNAIVTSSLNLYLAFKKPRYWTHIRQTLTGLPAAAMLLICCNQNRFIFGLYSRFARTDSGSDSVNSLTGVVHLLNTDQISLLGNVHSGEGLVHVARLQNTAIQRGLTSRVVDIVLLQALTQGSVLSSHDSLTAGVGTHSDLQHNMYSFLI
nr:MAG TPA: hypothetical protein [Caudoviricetes sp.]